MFTAETTTVKNQQEYSGDYTDDDNNKTSASEPSKPYDEVYQRDKVDNTITATGNNEDDNKMKPHQDYRDIRAKYKHTTVKPLSKFVSGFPLQYGSTKVF